MSLTLTMPKLWAKKIDEVPTIVPVEPPPLQVENPRQEILRLLDRAVRDRGREYIDRTHRPNVPVRIGSGFDYGCIVGYILGLKGVRASNAHLFSIYWTEFGWMDEQALLSEMIDLNDSGMSWGGIQDVVTRRYSVAA